MKIEPMGDAALFISGAIQVNPALGALEGVLDVVRGPGGVVVRHLPGLHLVDDVGRLLGEAPVDDPRGDDHELRCNYDGPDLAEVSRLTGLTISEVVERHSRVEYEVLATGFTPGFLYLGPLDPALHLARRATPRPSVPGGSVAIAAGQSGVYGVTTPGGWWLIGRTEVPTFDPRSRPPSNFQVGDRVRFIPV